MTQEIMPNSCQRNSSVPSETVVVEILDEQGRLGLSALGVGQTVA
jgi:hypothetical protein